MCAQSSPSDVFALEDSRDNIDAFPSALPPSSQIGAAIYVPSSSEAGDSDDKNESDDRGGIYDSDDSSYKTSASASPSMRSQPETPHIRKSTRLNGEKIPYIRMSANPPDMRRRRKSSNSVISITNTPSEHRFEREESAQVPAGAEQDASQESEQVGSSMSVSVPPPPASKVPTLPPPPRIRRPTIGQHTAAYAKLVRNKSRRSSRSRSVRGVNASKIKSSSSNSTSPFNSPNDGKFLTKAPAWSLPALREDSVESEQAVQDYLSPNQLQPSPSPQCPQIPRGIQASPSSLPTPAPALQPEKVLAPVSIPEVVAARAPPPAFVSRSLSPKPALTPALAPDIAPCTVKLATSPRPSTPDDLAIPYPEDAICIDTAVLHFLSKAQLGLTLPPDALRIVFRMGLQLEQHLDYLCSRVRKEGRLGPTATGMIDELKQGGLSWVQRGAILSALEDRAQCMKQEST